MTEVGVVLEAAPDDLGEWLADGAAFEAAGAAALWVDLEADGPLDPLALTAALAAVTSRSLLVTTVPATQREALARTLATVAALSRGRLRIFGAAFSEGETWDEDARPWLAVPSPENRSAWRATILDAEQRGHSRLMVPCHPRLLDILRNADEPDDRRDLHLAMG